MSDVINIAPKSNLPIPEFEFLIDDTYDFLIDDTYSFLIQGETPGIEWINTPKS